MLVQFNNDLELYTIKQIYKIIQSGTNSITEPLQSGFSAHNSTESTLLKVFNYILLAVDGDKNTVMLLLDLTVTVQYS